MKGQNWKLAVLVAATVGVMSGVPGVVMAQSQTDIERQTPRGLKDTDVERQAPQGLKDADVQRQAPQGLKDADVQRQQPQGLKDAPAPK
jgi:hypothetical protein